MKNEVRTAVYDGTLQVEAYRLQGIAQPFPAHFHDHYVIGLTEAGERRMICRGQTWTLQRGSMVLFCPGELHACVQANAEPFDYRGMNIPSQVMLKEVREAVGNTALPEFSQPALEDAEAACCLRLLHQAIMEEDSSFRKEELFLLLISRLLQQYGQPPPRSVPECRIEVESARAFMEKHFAEHLDLEQLCGLVHLSKSTLLRAFTRAKGITPYHYLVNLRICAAKRLLEQGASLLEAAMQTGFSDQSHFTNCFSRYIGLTPGTYQEIFTRAEKRG